MAAARKSPLLEMSKKTKTEFWNDSCSIQELTYAIENGATGGTTNPIIVGQVLKKDLAVWTPPHPGAS